MNRYPFPHSAGRFASDGRRVRRLRLRRPVRSPVAPDFAQARQSERARLAASIDVELQAACRSEAAVRRELGIAAHALLAGRGYRRLGFVRLSDYARERLGVSARTLQSAAWLAARLEALPLVGTAFDRSELSWVQALTLLPVVDRENAEAWMARAATVTVRRLADEVEWVLATRDALGAHAPLDPPALDSDLAPAFARTLADHCQEVSPNAGLQIGARSVSAEARAGECQKTAPRPALNDGARPSEVCDVEIQLTAPASVVALLRDTLDAFARSDEPRWRALERVLRHVIRYWESTPRHRDPVFARDGWRCRVPACSSRRNLHDHHVRYRSRGGGNERWNRTTICASHHLHGIHDGAIRAWGRAPRDIHWELGVRTGTAPLLMYVGDRICDGDGVDFGPLATADLCAYKPGGGS